MLPAAGSPNPFSHVATIFLIGICGFARVLLFGEADHDGPPLTSRLISPLWRATCGRAVSESQAISMLLPLSKSR
jgi:hypothetical protein